MKKAVIFAPFWKVPGHVGNNRVDRFVRWLVEEGFQVVIIRAGARNELCKTEWGAELTVRDPLGLYRDSGIEEKVAVRRRPNRFLYWLAYWLFNPDPSIIWGRKAAADLRVRAMVADADFILSSSPPESAHVGAWMLARRFNIPHIVDMRDGWLDEPLKPILINSALRRWLEARLEARIIADASRIFVTSNIWCDLLCRRLQLASKKIVVITNGYPRNTGCDDVKHNFGDGGNRLVLIHAGRFTGSRKTQKPILLLAPLLNAIQENEARGTVRLIGEIHKEEIAEIDKYREQFGDFGWHIECVGAMQRDRLLEVLPTANGLLLLSASHAAIPSKLFEYIASRRPILAVTEKGSATWQICEKLPQAFLVEFGCEPSESTVRDFLKCAATHNSLGTCPEEYSEKYLSRKFRDCICAL